MSWWKFLFTGCLVCSSSVWAVNAAPFVINSTQPDGSVVQIRKVGNARFNYTLTAEDSVLVVRDSNGYWNYADEHGKKTGMRVHARSKRGSKENNFLKKRDSRQILEKFRENRMKRLREQQSEETSSSIMFQSSAGAPRKANAWGGRGTQTTNWPTRPAFKSVKREGNVRGLVILVQFSDVKFKRDNAEQEYLDFLNKEGYSNYNMKGSVRDFFIANSSGKFRPTFDVAGPITLSGKRDSYGEEMSVGEVPVGAMNAISEAMDSLIARNVDFSPYDSDGDNVVDFVYMIYAGVGAADTEVSTAIWPHSYQVNKRLTKNMSMYSYACSSEIDGQAYKFRKNTDVIGGIGTFCHEFCHVLGLVDHYDVYADYKTEKQYTPIHWDLMDSGSYNCPQNKDWSLSCSPANLSAFERYSLGWLEPRRLEISDTTFVLKKIQENDGIVLTSKNDNEYYFVDFRQKEDFDVGLPNKGLLIWHIAYDRTAWARNLINISDPMRLDLIEADGVADLNTEMYDAFPTKRVNSFNGFVTWAGDSLGLEIYDIQLVDDYVTFKTRGNRVSPDAGSSSSTKASSSSKAVSSSSQKVSSSSVAASSSSKTTSSSSSSVKRSSSSSKKTSSSSGTDIDNPGSNSSSSVKTLISARMYATSKVRFSMIDGTLEVNAKFAGRKTLNLFDANGTLLKTQSFSGESCKIYMDALRGKAFVVATLESEGRLIKTYKVRMN